MRYKVNLFPPKERNFVDRAIYFSFNYLRYILVITQIIVIGVFFYRFKIDQEIIDLKDALKQKQEIVAISTPLVKEVRAVEQKVASIEILLTDQKKFQDDLSYLLSVFPEKLTLQRFDITNEGKISLAGVTTDPNIVKLFYERLKKDGKFKKVQLGSVKKEILDFSFSLELAKNNPTKKKI